MRRPFWVKSSQHWYIELNGKQIRLSKDRDPDGKDRKHPPPDVENEWHRLTREGVPTETLLADVFTRFRATFETAHYTKSSNYMLDQFQAFVGPTMRAEKLKPFHLSDFLKSKPTWGPSTQRTAVNRILAALNHAVREGVLTKNPISSVPGYKRQGRYIKRKGVITPELMTSLENKARPAFRAFLAVLWETGARPVELRRALIEKCSLENSFMLVPNKTAKATGNPERTIFLSERAKEIIRQRIGGRTSGPVFLTERRKSWSYANLQEHWRVLTHKIPVPKGITMYTIRRTFATKAINDRNVNAALVAQLMGHVDLGMVLKHYAQEDPEALKRAINEISVNVPPPSPTPETPRDRPAPP